MSSPLHISISHQSQPKAIAPASPIVSSPYKLARDAQKMSVTQAYFLAHKARAKLSSEAARPDHNLRLLVGHANLLDSLMLDLAEAEREQESWFNQSVRGATKSEDRHIQWADSVVEHDWQTEDADSDSDSDSDFSDEEDDDIEMADVVALRRIPSHTVKDFGYDMEEDDDEDDYYEDEDEDFAELALQRSPSHSASPPELDHDSDTSEDESMPPSPPTVVMPTFSEKTHDYHYSSQQETYSPKDAFYDEGFYLPPRNPARLVSAY